MAFSRRVFLQGAGVVLFAQIGLRCAKPGLYPSPLLYPSSTLYPQRPRGR